MTLEQVLKLYSESEKTREISQKLFSDGNSFVRLKALTGSSASFIASAVINSPLSQGREPVLSLSKKAGGCHLFILDDKEAAAFFLNDLENLL